MTKWKTVLEFFTHFNRSADDTGGFVIQMDANDEKFIHTHFLSLLRKSPSCPRLYSYYCDRFGHGVEKGIPAINNNLFDSFCGMRVRSAFSTLAVFKYSIFSAPSITRTTRKESLQMNWANQAKAEQMPLLLSSASNE